MSLLRYEAYRSVNHVFLAELPAHWEFRRLKHVADVFPSNVDKKSYDGQMSVRLCNYTDVYHNECITAHLDLPLATASAEQVGRFTLRADDVIITKDSETADDIAVAAHVPQDLPGVVCGYHLAMVRPISGLSGAFAKRFFDSRFAKAQFCVSASGLTRVGLGQYELDNALIPVPPTNEQLEIAKFLDRETSKIDTLIAEQRRLMGLLHEKRQAVICHAVTKGLNRTAPMRSSGIGWLGQIPAHWEVVQSRRVFALRNERASEVDVQLTASQKYGVIPQAEYTRLEGQNVVQVIKGADILKHVEPSDFVISMRSFQGGIEYSPHRGCVSSAYVVLAPREGICARYFVYALKSLTYVQALQSTSNLVRDGQALRWDNFTQVALPGIPLAEQAAIADYLDSETERIDIARVAQEKMVAILDERRTALISAAVTGQIDVRHLTAAEPA